MFKQSPALQKQQPEPIFESLFTRSSLMLFMLGEILTQALVTINSPATRARRELPNLPRRLRRLIFTVPTAMDLAPRPELEDRTRLVGLIWDGVPEFQAVYGNLCGALRQLGNPAEACCPIEALIPRASSIIDVELLQGLNNPPADMKDPFDGVKFLRVASIDPGTTNGMGGKDGKNGLPKTGIALVIDTTISMPPVPDAEAVSVALSATAAEKLHDDRIILSGKWGDGMP